MKMKIIYKIMLLCFIVLLTLIVIKRITPSTIECYDDNECFLEQLETCNKATYVMGNGFVGTHTVKIIGENYNTCDILYTVKNTNGDLVKNKQCEISKTYKPQHLYITDGLCE